MANTGTSAQSYFQLFDVLYPTPANPFLASFDSASGGDITINMVKYKTVDEKGFVINRSIPGQTTVSPVVLIKVLDKATPALIQLIKDASDGKCSRKNYSIAMIDGTGKALVYWHLYNALPVSVTGFKFTAGTDPDLTKLTFTFESERIEFIKVS